LGHGAGRVPKLEIVRCTIFDLRFLISANLSSNGHLPCWQIDPVFGHRRIIGTGKSRDSDAHADKSRTGVDPLRYLLLNLSLLCQQLLMRLPRVAEFAAAHPNGRHAANDNESQVAMRGCQHGFSTCCEVLFLDNDEVIAVHEIRDLSENSAAVADGEVRRILMTVVVNSPDSTMRQTILVT
jgi:hypothetical protein